MADVTLQVRINGGSVRTGGIRTSVAVGDTCQVTALSKAGWDGSRVLWEMFDYPPDFACPAGWSEDSDGVYYVAGSADPPAFVLTHWGKYLTRVTAANQSPDERTCIDIVSPAGLRDVMRREGAQFSGNRALWVKDQKLNWRTMEAFLQGGGAWTPAAIVGAYFWAKGISDPSLRTMSGANVVTMANGIDNGLVLTGSGSPAINSTNLLNGYPSLVLAASSELVSLSGGPVGNAAHWCIVLTDGNAPTTEALARNGAKNAASPVGFLGNPFFAAALPADFLPYADGASTPIPDGTPRVVGGHHLPSYGHKIVRVDGYTPQPGAGSNWTQAKTFSLTSEFGFGRAMTAGSANTSRIRDAVWGTGEISAGDYGRLIAYWKARFSLGALAPRILFLGDSLTDPTPVSPATTTWPALMTTTLNAQLTIDARTNVVTSNTALTGKMVNGTTWAAGNPALAFQSDGQYQTYVNAGIQGIHYSAPYSRSGRRRYDIAEGIGGTNDLIGANRTETQVIADLTYVFTKLRDAGYFRVWGTIPRGSTGGGYYDGTREPRRLAVNTWLTTTALTSGLIDEVGDFDAAGLFWNTTYYGAGPDLLHQNDTGKALMAAAMYEATYRLIRRIDP